MASTATPPGPGGSHKLGGAALLAHVTAPVVVLSADGRVREFNPAAADALGLAPAALGRPLPDLLADAGAADAARAALAELGPDRPAISVRLPHRTAGGTRLATWTARTPLDGRRVLGIVCTEVGCAGLTPERATETDNPAEHEIVLSAISDAVFITDDDGRFTFICPNVHVIFGYVVDEVRTMGRIDRLLGRDLATRAQELTPQRPEIANIEHRIRDKRQREHVLLVNIKRVAIRSGTRLYTCRDITERRQIEARLHAAQAELAHAARLSTVGELASGFAHELNQPLSAISNYATACLRLIRGGQSTRDELVRPLEQIAAQSHRAASIIQRVRSFLRKQPARRDAARVDALLREALALLQPGIDREPVTVQLDVAAGLPPVQVDAVGIQQVVVNLVLNAVEAVAAGNAAPSAPIVVSAAQRPAGEIEIGVRDRGPGLSPARLEQVFEPMYTTKPDGTGLGLSISRSIVEAHGGRLWATPEPDGGVTFRFTLPPARTPPDGRAKSSPLDNGGE